MAGHVNEGYLSSSWNATERLSKKKYFSHKSARVLKNVIDRSAKGDFHSIMLKGVCKNHECQSIYIFSSKKTMDHMLNEKLVNNEF